MPMKVLIWILCIFANSFFTTALKTNGISLGALPTLVLWGGTIFLARTLCKEWDDHKRRKQSTSVSSPVPSAGSQPVPVSQSAGINTPQILFCRKCGEKLIENSQFCRKCGTEVKKE